jgi:hypothetical protein
MSSSKRRNLPSFSFTPRDRDAFPLPAAVTRTRQVTSASTNGDAASASAPPVPGNGAKPPKRVKQWHPQQEVVLKQWAEIATSFRWMHHECHVKLANQSFWFTLPVIVISSITGTMNFAQGTFPASVEMYVPLIIGTLNLLGGIMTTVASYLKVAELAEGHRVASVMFGKLSRNMRVELLLPLTERTMDGDDFIAMCRSEMDRLTEQTPNIPKNVERQFIIRFRHLLEQNFYPPELLQLHPVDVYREEAPVMQPPPPPALSPALQSQALSAPVSVALNVAATQASMAADVKEELAQLQHMKPVSSALGKEVDVDALFAPPPSALEGSEKV